jgi:hypothetical protein
MWPSEPPAENGRHREGELSVEIHLLEVRREFGVRPYCARRNLRGLVYGSGYAGGRLRVG